MARELDEQTTMSEEFSAEQVEQFLTARDYSKAVLVEVEAAMQELEVRCY